MQTLFTATLILLISTMAQAASFDCTKAASATEKLICGNESVSALDEQLGQAYKQAITNTENKDAIKQQQLEWLKKQRACKDTGCLTQHYQARIAQLQKMEASSVSGAAQAVGQTQPAAAKEISKKSTRFVDGKRKNQFVLTHDTDAEGVCEDYLKVLNRTAWDDLFACKLPDLTGSPFQSVNFKPLTGEALKAMDKIVYEQDGGGPHTGWEQKWPEREKEYAMGYRKLGEAYWDLDKDGQPDQIIEEQRPDLICDPLGEGELGFERKTRELKWKQLSVAEQYKSAMQVGFSRGYYLISNGIMAFIDADNFLTYKNQFISVSQFSMAKKNADTKFVPDATWLYISDVSSTKDIKYREYPMGSLFCKYSLKDK